MASSEERDPDDEMFDVCAAFLRQHSSMPDEEKLRVYSLFKQATTGDCNTVKPSFFDFVGQAKWNAWKKLEGTTQGEARGAYIRFVLDRFPDEFRDYCALNPPDGPADAEQKSGAGGASGGMAPAVSTLGGDMKPTTVGEAVAAAAERMLSPEQMQSVLGHAARGDADALAAALSEGAQVDAKDENDRTALHWAAEGGFADCVGKLLEAGAQVDAADADGQTPLHVACLCEEAGVARLLLDAGAAKDLADAEGETPAALAAGSSSEDLKALFS